MNQVFMLGFLCWIGMSLAHAVQYQEEGVGQQALRRQRMDNNLRRLLEEIDVQGAAGGEYMPQEQHGVAQNPFLQMHQPEGDERGNYFPGVQGFMGAIYPNHRGYPERPLFPQDAQEDEDVDNRRVGEQPEEERKEKAEQGYLSSDDENFQEILRMAEQMSLENENENLAEKRQALFDKGEEEYERIVAAHNLEAALRFQQEETPEDRATRELIERLERGEED